VSGWRPATSGTNCRTDNLKTCAIFRCETTFKMDVLTELMSRETRSSDGIFEGWGTVLKILLKERRHTQTAVKTNQYKLSYQTICNCVANKIIIFKTEGRYFNCRIEARFCALTDVIINNLVVR
jgi:hypothetical protein